MLERPLVPLLCCLPLALTAACGDDGGGGNTATIDFAVKVGSATAACGTSYDNLGSNNDSAQLKDMRLYVTNVRLIDDTGAEVPFSLTPDGQFQSAEVALLDFEDGSGGCSDEGDARMHTQLQGSIPDGTYTGIAFEMGVPFALNHADIAGAEPPLNVSAMYWAWAIGHRFLKIDLDVNGGANRWNVHVGSNMCDAPSMLEPPATGCQHPNRAQIQLDNFTLGSSTVVLDLQTLLANSDITANAANTAYGCQSFPDDADECTNLYPSLGMDFSTGQCTSGCAQQTAFRLD